MVINENLLDDWVRRNAEDAQGLLAELVWRLVCVSCPGAQDRRFPLADSVGQHGTDGSLVVEYPFPPFVPKGQSFWELGAGLDAAKKAKKDYRDRTKATPAAVRKKSTFIFVTPLSGRRGWKDTWKRGAQSKWLQTCRRKRLWKQVQVIDGTRIVDWLHQFPAVELWLAQRLIGSSALDIEAPEVRWDRVRTIGQPPPLSPDVFLAGRKSASQKFGEMFARPRVQLKLDTHHPEQAGDFIAASIAALPLEQRAEAAGRCLIVRDRKAWMTVVGLVKRHVLVADFDLDGDEGEGARLLESADRADNSVVTIGLPGGFPHPNRISLPTPKVHEVAEALQKAGYKEARARTLAQKCEGNLASLIRALQHLSKSPSWADSSEAGELTIALLLGSWSESNKADKAAAEGLSGKAYGEWIGKLQQVVLRPATPLTHRDGNWKFAGRFEGWYALGPRLFDPELGRLRKLAVEMLREKDPKFDLPKSERFAAGIYGKVLSHSSRIRKGLAETLALLGSHPKALTSCSFGMAESIATLSVREILSDADWHLWASLNNILPLLAEASPREFMDAVDRALNSSPCPFDLVFEQESTGFAGGNYLTGLLWALETLAWTPDFLARACLLLAKLASRDPGGNWVNRPSHSLSMIFLPWMPQTIASPEARKVALETLSRDAPKVAWPLLLSLLPSSHQTSSGTSRPVWREFIPDDWSRGVSDVEYQARAEDYAHLALKAAAAEPDRLSELIGQIDHLPEGTRTSLLKQITSGEIKSVPEDGRAVLWNAIVDLVAKHHKYSNAKWAMPRDLLASVEAAAKDIAPESATLLYKRLFGDHDFSLLEGEDDYQGQLKRLDAKRRDVIGGIAGSSGVQGVLEFAKVAESPWKVGKPFGEITDDHADRDIFPALLLTDDKILSQFCAGYVLGRFNSRGWNWVDAVDKSGWSPAAVGQFMSYMPFSSQTWSRLARVLPGTELEYWNRCAVAPYPGEGDLTIAIDELIRFGRPYAALRCLYGIRKSERGIDSNRAIKALRAALQSKEVPYDLDAHGIVELFSALQDMPGVDRDELGRLEWAYLPLLEPNNRAKPKVLEQELAERPGFFSEIIRTVFRSRTKPATLLTASPDRHDEVVKNGYKLLDNWSTPPGTLRDGSFSAEALDEWLIEVRRLCEESGHLESALRTVGKVLVSAPRDPKGLWIHGGVAAVLNANDAADIRRGFNTELYNARGVHTFSSGKEEKTIAARYRQQAAEVEAEGFHRLADSLRELAEQYERDSERESTRDPFED